MVVQGSATKDNIFLHHIQNLFLIWTQLKFSIHVVLISHFLKIHKRPWLKVIILAVCSIMAHQP